MPLSLSTLSGFAPLRLQRVRITHDRDSKPRTNLFFNAASSPLYFVTALTALFESIAMIVDQHQPVVEKYYGAGKMRLVVERLLDECDRVTKSLKENWEEDRSIQRKVCAIFLHCTAYTHAPCLAQ